MLSSKLAKGADLIKVAGILGENDLKLDQQSASSSTQDTVEASLKEKLGFAATHENHIEQCILLESLAEHYLQQKDKHAEAAMFLNVALAIFNKHKANIMDDNLGARLFLKARSIEVDYVRKNVKVSYSREETTADYGINPSYKENLEKARQEGKATVNLWPNPNTKEGISELRDYSQLVTMQVISILETMILEGIELMQSPPPCEYAFVGTGSLAREEMTFYSDFEYFILLSENNEENRQYFEHVSNLLEIKIIMLGETNPSYNRDLLPNNMSTPVRKGFSLDVHKQAGNKTHSLIGTPNEMSRYQLPGETFVHEPRNHLSSALVTGIYVSGSANGFRLFEQYNKCLEAIFNAAFENDSISLRKTRALFLVKEDIEHFRTKLESGNEQGKILQVKNQLYRLPQTTMDGLALYFDLKPASTWDRIELLVEKGIVTAQAGDKLKKLVGISLYWRLKTYNNYGEQRELIDVLQYLSVSAFAQYHSQNIGCSQQDINDLSDCYMILSSLEHTMGIFCEAEDKEGVLRLMTLSSEGDYGLQGLVAMRLCQYAKAIVCFEKGREEQKSQKDIRLVTYTMELATAHLAQKNAKQAIKYFEELIALINSIPNYKDKELTTLRALYCIGRSWAIMEQVQRLPGLVHTQKALEFFNACLIRYKELLGEDHPLVAEVLSSIGERQAAQGDYEAAMQNFRRSFVINVHAHGTSDPTVADDLNSMGFVLNKMKKPNEARPYLDVALKISRDLFGASHFNVATILANLSETFELGGDLKMAIAMLSSALGINQSIFGPQYPSVVNDGFKLSQLLFNIGDLELAEKLLTELVTLTHQTNNYVMLASSLNNLGAIFLNTERYDMALQTFQACRATQKKIYPDIDERVARTCHNLSIVQRYKGQYIEAVKNLEEELHIYVNLQLLEKTQIIGLIAEISDTYKSCGNGIFGVRFIERTNIILQLLSIKYGNNDSDILKCRANLEIAKGFFAARSLPVASANGSPVPNITPQYNQHLNATLDPLNKKDFGSSPKKPPPL